jgi:hypothetical protein
MPGDSECGSNAGRAIMMADAWLVLFTVSTRVVRGPERLNFRSRALIIQYYY